MTTGQEKPHLSHTQLEMYWRCPESYRRRYMEKEIIPPGIALILGGSVHAGAELNFKQKIESHEDLPAENIIDCAVATFETEIAGGYALDEEEANRGPSVVIADAKNMTAALAQLHAEEQAPDYQPVAVEKVTRIELPRASHDLLAVTDLIDDRDGVTDFKTAKRAKRQDEVETSAQLTIYAAAMRVEMGRLPGRVGLDVLVKTKVPKRQLLLSTRTEADLQVLANRINVTLEAINGGCFPPCPAGSWNCSSRWCGYWRTCPYVNSERRSAAEGD